MGLLAAARVMIDAFLSLPHRPRQQREAKQGEGAFLASYPSGEYADHVAPQIFPLWGENDLFFSSSFVTFSFPLSINLLFLLLCSRGRALHAVSTVQYITVSFERPKTEVRNLSFFPNFPFLCAMGPKAELPTPFLPSCLSRSKRTVKETERWEGRRETEILIDIPPNISAFFMQYFLLNPLRIFATAAPAAKWTVWRPPSTRSLPSGTPRATGPRWSSTAPSWRSQSP